MASLLKVDALTGVTTAGSISVTGEGNSTTTNLQQGLAKQWAKFTVAAALNDSLNTSSITDTGTGNFEVNFSNVMGNANYAVTTCTFTTAGRETHCDASSTSAYGIATWYNMSRSEDTITGCGTEALGDLA